ncbi:MAG: hypothetical protein WCI71_13180 [Bacteroidota bacterium]
MKRIFLLFAAGFLALSGHAQIDKTQLSLEVSKTNENNIKLLSTYTWKRTVEGFVEGEQVFLLLSSATVGPDGKPAYQVIDKSGSSLKKSSKKQAQAAENIKNAVELVSKYIFMSTGQLVDLFNKGTLSLLNDDLNAEAFNFFSKGDHIKYTYDKKSLQYKTQVISTLLNGEPVKASVTYRFVDDLNIVDKVVLEMPAKKIKVNITNTEFAKKL